MEGKQFNVEAFQSALLDSFPFLLHIHLCSLRLLIVAFLPKPPSDSHHRTVVFYIIFPTYSFFCVYFSIKNQKWIRKVLFLFQERKRIKKNSANVVSMFFLGIDSSKASAEICICVCMLEFLMIDWVAMSFEMDSFWV